MTLDLQAEYHNRACVPEHPAIMAGWAKGATAWRAAAPPAELDLPLDRGPRAARHLLARPRPHGAARSIHPRRLLASAGQGLVRPLRSGPRHRRRRSGDSVTRPVPFGRARPNRRGDAGCGDLLASPPSWPACRHRPLSGRTSERDAALRSIATADVLRAPGFIQPRCTAAGVCARLYSLARSERQAQHSTVSAG